MLRNRLHNLAMLPKVSPAQTLLAQPGSVDLWWFPYEAPESSELLLHAPALLTQSEKERHDRFHFARDRKQFLATRLLVRTVLSRYVATPAAAWRFAQEPHGKPYIESPLPSPPLHFNLSNTYGLVVCTVSAAHAEIGVDVESLERDRTPLDIASHYFSAAEVTALQAQPWDCQPDFFYALWTLKESYIKARGLGTFAAAAAVFFCAAGRRRPGHFVRKRAGRRACKLAVCLAALCSRASGGSRRQDRWRATSPTYAAATSAVEVIFQKSQPQPAPCHFGSSASSSKRARFTRKVFSYTLQFIGWKFAWPGSRSARRAQAVQVRSGAGAFRVALGVIFRVTFRRG